MAKIGFPELLSLHGCSTNQQQVNCRNKSEESHWNLANNCIEQLNTQSRRIRDQFFKFAFWDCHLSTIEVDCWGNKVFFGPNKDIQRSPTKIRLASTSTFTVRRALFLQPKSGKWYQWSVALRKLLLLLLLKCYVFFWSLCTMVGHNLPS